MVLEKGISRRSANNSDKPYDQADCRLDPSGPDTGTERPPTSGMSHIAIQEQVNGQVVEWMEKVSDIQYRKDSQ